MRSRSGPIFLLSILVLAVLGVLPAEAGRRHREGTVEQLLDLDVQPFAIGHRGFGENLGEDPSRPIENTVAAVRAGFRAGLSVVEVDVQLTLDHRVVAFHDDVVVFPGDALPTCLNTLTLSEIQARLPHVPTLQAVLQKARRFNRPSGPLQGLVVVELKAPAPMCDPDDVQERAIVSAVIRVIRQQKMTDQVMLASLSPALLSIAAKKAKDITRVLTISGLQFLTEEEVEFLLGLEVTRIDKRRDVGLPWAEVGSILRLPSYAVDPDGQPRSPVEAIATAIGTALAVGARVIEADLLLLGLFSDCHAEADTTPGRQFVASVHSVGLEVFGFTAANRCEWRFLESLGVDGIYTDDVPLGVRKQAPIP